MIDSRAFKYSPPLPLPNFTETLHRQARCVSLPLLVWGEKTVAVTGFFPVVMTN